MIILKILVVIIMIEAAGMIVVGTVRTINDSRKSRSSRRESCTGATEKDYVNPTHQGKK